MIKELANRDLFHKDSEVLKKYFINKERTATEIEKIDQLSKLVVSFYQKVYDSKTHNVNYSMFDFDFRTYGYLEDYGYYIIDYDMKNYYFIQHLEDIHDAFIAVARRIMYKKYEEHVHVNHKEIKKNLKTRSNDIKSFSAIYQYEYELSKWSKYFDGEVPQALIDMYNKLANMTYYASSQKLSFEYDELQKIFQAKAKKANIR